MRLRMLFLAGLIAAAGLFFLLQPANAAKRSVIGIQNVASPAAPGSAEPNLATGPDGRVYMSWLEPADSGHALRFAVHDGRSWSAARTIARGRDFFVNWADFPSIEALDGGRLAAHWLQRNGKGTYAYGVRISQSRDGGKTWSAPVTPHRDSTESEHGFVAMWREKGGLGAVWLDGRKFSKEGHDASNEMMVVSTTISPTGARGPEVRLDERTCDCCQNAATVTSNGPIVAYRNRSQEEIRDIYVTRRVGTRWTTGTPVHIDNWKIAACPVNGPALSANGRRVVLAWFTAARDTARVNVAFSNDAGATFGSPVRVDGGAPAGRVDVALLSDGGALVTWVERVGGDTAAVRLRRITRDGKIGSTVTIAASSAARASGFPRMAVTGQNVMFAWTVPGKPSTIRVARAALSDLH
ncbi:MAG: exo-alpha-sialidase [Gemmatimonadaceae bacterium]|nr:exo-alpha-sialidase [Gemmatimonadaceae bacterium]